MAKTFRLEIVTPEEIVLAEDVTSVVVPAEEGYLGVLAGHAPLLAALRPGEIRIQAPAGDRYFATSGGFLEVTPRKTSILSEAVEAPAELDPARSRKALDRARERLRGADPAVDRERARAALDRAENRIRIAEKRKR